MKKLFAAIEYGMLAGFVSILIIPVASGVGSRVNDIFNAIAMALP